MTIKNNFFVITGGPSSGKTTVAQALQQEGYAYVEEVARDLLKEKGAAGVDIALYRNTPEFVEIEFERSLNNYMQAQEKYPDAITFFDRGIVDVLMYARFRHIPISDYMHQTALTHRYNKIVFIAPPWRAIYRLDKERIEPYEEAVRIFHMNELVYQEYGYTLVELPLTTIEDRITFIIKTLKDHSYL